MKRTILVCGHGPGISDAVARRFGREDFAVAIVARNGERLDASAAALNAAGITAKPFVCDLGDTSAVRTLVQDVRASLGPIGVLHWNAYLLKEAPDLLTASSDELRRTVDVTLHGFIAAVQEAAPDLQAQKGALLVTAGALALQTPRADVAAVHLRMMGLSVAKSAQYKATALLRTRLAPDVYVGEVIIRGIVAGTPHGDFAAAIPPGIQTIEPADVAEQFWRLSQSRTEPSVMLG
jgi:NAD(P)-dependent dehydrogenase (short-subunit alcohol dehydrogenase family)